jgi:hypothetical protein
MARDSHRSFSIVRSIQAALMLLVLAAALPAPLIAGPTLNPQWADNSKDRDENVERLAKAISAVVKLKSKALPNARSLATLGAEREGNGIVVGPNGLVLTIGYLIVETETIELETNDGKVVPASLVAYDTRNRLRPWFVRWRRSASDRSRSGIESLRRKRQRSSRRRRRRCRELDHGRLETALRRLGSMIDGAIFHLAATVRSQRRHADHRSGLVGIGSLIVGRPAEFAARPAACSSRSTC